MNLFKGLIICKSCGKKYNGKLEGKSYNYVCSGYKNYGVTYCTRNVIHEEILLNIIRLHLPQTHINNATDVKQIISKIEVKSDIITIYYIDNTKSELNNSYISI